MATKNSIISVSTSAETDIIDITADVESVISQNGIDNGFVVLFIPGSTAALTTIEYEQGVVEDLKKAIDRIAPENMEYEHDKRWGDGNGYSHVRASLMGPSLCVPVIKGKLAIGTWQQVVLCDFDNRARSRKIIVQVYK